MQNLEVMRVGQAKQRKLNDPNYGKPSKMRGLIISNPLILRGNTIVKSSPLDLQDLRSSLMYWDRLALPLNNQVGSASIPDVDYLESSGVLYKPRFTSFGKSELEKWLVNVQLATLAEYEKNEQGVWSISGGKNSIVSENLNQTDGTMIQLLNAVPVPGENVPLAEILEFKTKRRDQLLAFREHFESLSAKVANAPDSVDELAKVLREVDLACSDLLKTTREWGYPVKIANTHASFNIDILKAAETANEVYDFLSNNPIGLSTTSNILAAAGAALASQFKVGADIKFQGIKRPKSPYKYAYLVQRDLS
ncbi:DUF6236 family protein [Pseudomonas fortuita]|uniref:DUF6236 family protein n=1 Tax=Pseudomonas fortuita TaxID=3233375 RepID=UPI003C2BEC89